MKVDGNIFLSKKDIAFSKLEIDNADLALEKFLLMLDEVKDSKDNIYYKYSEEWEEFFVKLSNFSDDYWQGASQVNLNLLLNESSILFSEIEEKSIFDLKEEPKTFGGFQYNGCPTSDYVCSKETIDEWHDDWFYNNPDRIDWGEHKHDIWPRYDRLIHIIEMELIRHKVEVPLKHSDYVNSFHEQIIKHKDERERISYIQEIVKKICCANYYHRESELERLEFINGNSRATNIYSIKKDGKFLFICVDTKHGMLEYCDDSGEHIMEIRFDGTKNKEKDLSHSLRCVSDWKRKK